MALRTMGGRIRRPTDAAEKWWHRPDNIVITLTLILTFAVATILHLPAKSAPLKIANDSTLTVSLEVRRAGTTGWMGLGTFVPGRTTVREVIDQGKTWEVRAQAGSHVAEPFSVTRAQLARQKWTLDIPDVVTESLRRSGAQPEP